VNIYLTGGTGFIGSHVVKTLCGGRNRITVLARNRGKVPALGKLPGVRVVRAPMQDLGAIYRIMVRPDALIHIALCWGDTAEDMIRNETIPSVALLDLAARKGAKSVIFTSSTAATGYAPKRISETSLPRPEDYYGASKSAVEGFVCAFGRKYPRTRFNVIRPGYVFGNPAVPDGSIQGDRRFHRICEAVKAGKDLEFNEEDGTQFIEAGDLAKIYKAILGSGARDQIYFGLSRNFVPWYRIAEWARQIAGSRSRIKVPNRGHGPKPHLFVLNKIRDEFGLSFNSVAAIRNHLKYILSGM
jgi:UDP-glucose 4-epimerase